MELKSLCRELASAKQRLFRAQEHLRNIENEILLKIPPKLEGSQTIPVPGFKLTTTHKLSRSLDYDAYMAIVTPATSFVKLKPSIDLKQLRAIEQVNPDMVAQCVTAKPAKTAIKVEEVSDET